MASPGAARGPRRAAIEARGQLNVSRPCGLESPASTARCRRDSNAIGSHPRQCSTRRAR
jgi:hypothetical protein